MFFDVSFQPHHHCSKEEAQEEVPAFAQQPLALEAAEALRQAREAQGQ